MAPIKIALAVLSLMCLATVVQARRLALVIGNDSYQNVQQLKNARSDAKAIAAELKSVGFDVTLKTDLNQKMMKSALRDFKSQVQGGDEPLGGSVKRPDVQMNLDVAAVVPGLVVGLGWCLLVGKSEDGRFLFHLR